MTASLAAMKALLGRLAQGATLAETEAEEAFDIIMSGDATPAQIGAFLMALRLRGETVEEIAGAAKAMRAKMLRVKAPTGAIDIVGTGGDATGTYNISTAASLVAAGCGVAVAKHGNRALSSKSGAADVLAALGVKIDADLSLVEKSLVDAKIAFLMAPRHHGAMRHVAGPRVELGHRTVFNILGPLCNPAGVTRQMTGAFSPDWLEPMARVLGKLGSERAWVVHGQGMDELATTGPSHVVELKDGAIRRFEVTPEEAGLKRATLADLTGGDPAHNAQALRDVLAGKPSAYRDMVVLNAAAALVVADRAPDLKAGAALAAKALDSGAARTVLERLIAISQSAP
ncbi:MAG: anthranilate phosphoribosyltransferase [Rhodospirillales bacterium]|nr:anthranilate phosphoribosyltransferase [Rhodospirillales bacterium]